MARTAHFSLHVLLRPEPALGAGSPDLSTGSAAGEPLLVDDSPSTACSGWRLGLVLPKKQARRSVTRSLLRHQAREAFRRHAPIVLAAGRHGAEVDGWVVRLRAPFDRKLFPSAASEALSAVVRQELDELWSRLGGPRA